MNIQVALKQQEAKLQQQLKGDPGSHHCSKRLGPSRAG
jgi:hypothetical protein